MLHVPSYELGKVLGRFDKSRGITRHVRSLAQDVLSIPDWIDVLYPNDGTEENTIPLVPSSIIEGYFFVMDQEGS